MRGGRREAAQTGSEAGQGSPTGGHQRGVPEPIQTKQRQRQQQRKQTKQLRWLRREDGEGSVSLGAVSICSVWIRFIPSPQNKHIQSNPIQSNPIRIREEGKQGRSEGAEWSRSGQAEGSFNKKLTPATPSETPSLPKPANQTLNRTQTQASK